MGGTLTITTVRELEHKNESLEHRLSDLERHCKRMYWRLNRDYNGEFLHFDDRPVSEARISYPRKPVQ